MLSQSARDAIAQTLPLLEQRKDDLIDRLAAYLSACDSDPGGGDPEMVAMMLTEMLLIQAAHLARTGDARMLDDVGAEHAMLGIHGHHYSRFGDALGAVVHDVLGCNVPRTISSAWVDAFWSIIRAVQACGEADAAVAGFIVPRSSAGREDRSIR